MDVTFPWAAVGHGSPNQHSRNNSGAVEDMNRGAACSLVFAFHMFINYLGSTGAGELVWLVRTTFSDFHLSRCGNNDFDIVDVV